MNISELPITEAIRPRPVYARFLKRMAFDPLEPPTDEEKLDAIKVMQVLYPGTFAIDKVLLAEAERILHESDVR